MKRKIIVKFTKNLGKSNLINYQKTLSKQFFLITLGKISNHLFEQMFYDFLSVQLTSNVALFQLYSHISSAENCPGDLVPL